MSLHTIKQEFTDKRVAVVGYGVFGRSAVEFIQRCAPQNLVILDDNPNIDAPQYCELRTGKEAFTDLSEFDVVVRSPGFPPDRLGHAKKVITDSGLLLRYFKQHVIGVTGTKGKSTSVRLIATLLEAAGQEALAAGNIGRSYFDIFSDIKADTVVVAELSSYQLADVDTSPHWALLLPIASDHLTWHGSQEAYEQAKANIFRRQTDADTLIYWDGGTTKRLIEESPPSSRKKSYPAETEFGLSGTSIVFKNARQEGAEHEIVKTAVLLLKGEHNFYNIIGCLSIVAEILREKNVELDQPVLDELIEALCRFQPLEHHIQEVTTLKGVTFIDDSYASNPVAVQAALKTVTGPKVLILGGQSRELDLTPVVQLLDEAEVRTVVLIGVDADYRSKLANLISEKSATEVIDLGDASMEQIVTTGVEYSQKGDSILLSPGHPSFDMFDNFIDRGEQFQRAVQLIADENS